jgi:RimJ/RimL family protein N-acetyltransferase
VLQRKGVGIGRACVRLLAAMAFRDLGAHRFWLDVKERNARALGLYRSEGFVEEGRLRDEAGWQALIVMSMLRAEHEAMLESRRLLPTGTVSNTQGGAE